MAKTPPKSEAEHAAEYGCDVRTIRRWKAAKAPLDKPEAMKEWIAARHCGPTGSEPASLADAKLKKVLLECDRLAHRNAVEAGLYTHNDAIRADMLRIGAATRAALQTLRADAPTWEGLPAAEIERRVSDRIDRICADLHDQTSKLYS